MQAADLLIPEWPCYLGRPAASGVIRLRPEDFIVEEIGKVDPSGEGAHLWLWLEKREANTDWVAGKLAQLAGCPRRDVGYAGLKDRHAVTRQWFSIPWFKGFDGLVRQTGIEGVNILECRRHGRKLKRGVLNGNRFCLKIRRLEGQTAGLERRLVEIKKQGVPNYFGPQRFGRQGRNAVRGYELLANGACLGRTQRSIYLSALRSFLFNQVLAERVRQGNWNAIIDGELAMLDGSQSIFACEHVMQDIEDRCERLDIHPTGPLAGSGGMQPGAEALELEQRVLLAWDEVSGVLAACGVKSARRALRLYPAEFDWSFDGPDLALKFVLPPGCYATALLREVLHVADGHGTPARTAVEE